MAGDALPFGVGDLDELAGLTVSVVDSDGAVVLTGQVGVAKAADRDNDDNNDGPEASGESCLVSTAADNATRGKVEVKRDGSKFELEVEVRGLAPAAVFEVNLSSAAGESAVVGSLVTSGRGRGELEIEGSLPLGVATVEELTGATLTITDADGMAVLTGITPALGDRADCGNEDEDKKGVLLTATGGTLYLDNVEAISLEAQTKLLRVLAEKTVRPVGGEASVDFDARCIASSQRELRELCHRNEFRRDLYFRLCGIAVALPPLRERAEDIPELVEQFRDQLSNEGVDFHPDALRVLQGHHWPGNVRELECLVRRLALTSEGLIREADVVCALGQRAVSTGFPRWVFEGKSYNELLETVKREHLLYLFERCEGDVGLMAAELGTTTRSVYLRFRQAGLRLGDLREEKSD